MSRNAARDLKSTQSPSNVVMLTAALLDLLRTRLAEHAAEPEGGVRWEALRDRLLKRGHA